MAFQDRNFLYLPAKRRQFQFSNNIAFHNITSNFSTRNNERCFDTSKIQTGLEGFLLNVHVPPLLPQLPVYSCLVSLSALEIWFWKQLRPKPRLRDHFCLQLSRIRKIKPCPCFLSLAKLEKPPHFKPQAISVPRLSVSPSLLWKQLISRLSWHYVLQDQCHNKTPHVKCMCVSVPCTGDFETGSNE